jgi:tetratricopeptide (TPR) repeat protein
MANSALGNHADAVLAAERAVEIQPGDGDSLMFLSAALSYAGKFEAARDAAIKAHRIDPKFGPYLNALGRACFMLGRYDESNEAYELGASLGTPIAAPMLISWIVDLVQLGREEEARKKGRELLLYRPDFSIARTDEVYPFGDHILPLVAEGLRKAGLPE